MNKGLSTVKRTSSEIEATIFDLVVTIPHVLLRNINGSRKSRAQVW